MNDECSKLWCKITELTGQLEIALLRIRALEAILEEQGYEWKNSVIIPEHWEKKKRR